MGRRRRRRRGRGRRTRRLKRNKGRYSRLHVVVSIRRPRAKWEICEEYSGVTRSRYATNEA